MRRDHAAKKLLGIGRDRFTCVAVVGIGPLATFAP